MNFDEMRMGHEWFPVLGAETLPNNTTNMTFDFPYEVNCPLGEALLNFNKTN